MTTITTTTTEISLAKLTPSPANVRRTRAGAGIEALATSIQAHGLLQSLVVRPKLDKEGQATEHYEVVAGARRGSEPRDHCRSRSPSRPYWHEKSVPHQRADEVYPNKTMTKCGFRPSSRAS